MQTLSSLNSSLLSQIDPDLEKAARAARVLNSFAESLMASTDTTEAGLFMLDHIQAVYVMRDDAPLKSGKTPIVLRIYSDDSVVRAELDARQEWIRLQLAQRGIRYDKMIIHASKYGMRKRRPFERFIAEVTGSDLAPDTDVTRHEFTEDEVDALSARVENPQIANSLRAALEATALDAATPRAGDMPHTTAVGPTIDKLETLKRAFCLTFGENADTVLEKINAAYIVPLVQKDDDRPLRFQKNRCTIFSSDPRFATVMNAYDAQIRKHAYHLGLRIYGRISIRTAPASIADKRAFPPLSAPVIVSLESDR